MTCQQWTSSNFWNRSSVVCTDQSNQYDSNKKNVTIQCEAWVLVVSGTDLWYTVIMKSGKHQRESKGPPNSHVNFLRQCTSRSADVTHFFVSPATLPAFTPSSCTIYCKGAFTGPDCNDLQEFTVSKSSGSWIHRRSALLLFSRPPSTSYFIFSIITSDSQRLWASISTREPILPSTAVGFHQLLHPVLFT